LYAANSDLAGDLIPCCTGLAANERDLYRKDPKDPVDLQLNRPSYRSSPLVCGAGCIYEDLLP